MYKDIQEFKLDFASLLIKLERARKDGGSVTLEPNEVAAALYGFKCLSQDNNQG